MTNRLDYEKIEKKVNKELKNLVKEYKKENKLSKRNR